MATFNPYELDKPVLRLGDYGDYTLGDITESRAKQLDAIFEEMAALNDGDNGADVPKVVALVAQLAEAACEKSDGLAERIQKLFADEEIGVLALRGMSQFIMEWLQGEQTAGEG